ncbi:hypothetical protein SHI21_07050 [Bacteriovorax sp. PP10]|uniref:Oxidoreductase molybdopterin-binding domain-containing protein n=1 Tax=Bacteriovorax antarcticus TaxID=3088717 RepID=A0ABU5VWE7_9BACT|nr:hypothetical protein [Bacteriovorax sp. PP10]MEA9355950.1 hypothetical protein [Bacteriovorax sp. PP10]
MKQLFILFFILILSVSASAKSPYPRQKIILSGSLLPTAPKVISVKDMEDFKNSISITIFDPYDKNTKSTFFGFYLKDLVLAYGSPDFKVLRVGAIDGYKVDIPKEEIMKGNLFYTYKDNLGYLTVDRMGPARIIAPVDGIVNKDLLLKIGVYWVWQIKTIEFIK